MEPIFVALFTGEETSREAFIKRIIEGMLDPSENPFVFYPIILEAGKNMYDHAEGKGYVVIFQDEDGSYHFVVRDFGTDKFDYDSLRGKSRLEGNKTNFGKGLNIILEISAFMGITLHINPMRGFLYCGTYNPSP